MAPHATSARLATRDDSPSDNQSGMTPTIIAGICVASAILLGIAVWLAIRWYRKRATAKRRLRRGSAFTGPSYTSEKSPLPSALPVKGTFSQDQLNATVVMPKRAVLPPGASPDQIYQHYTEEGKLPRPFAPPAPTARPSLTVDVPMQRPWTPAARPASTASWLSNVFPLAGGRHSRNPSAVSGISSVFSSQGASQGHEKVRQIFDPVLPDELVISVGETLTIVQHFEDGWCIAGRDSVFKPGEVELGAIPAWCFLKPVKGLRAERPMRVSSLGVTVNVDAKYGLEDRDNAISWSNF